MKQKNEEIKHLKEEISDLKQHNAKLEKQLANEDMIKSLQTKLDVMKQTFEKSRNQLQVSVPPAKDIENRLFERN